jgi:hypothetical protein
MRLSPDAFAQLAYEPRFADAGLTREQYHLAFAVPRLLLPTQHQRDFLLATDERG